MSCNEVDFAFRSVTRVGYTGVYLLGYVCDLIVNVTKSIDNIHLDSGLPLLLPYIVYGRKSPRSQTALLPS